MFLVIFLLTACNDGRMTYRLDTNVNEFRLYPLDIKKPSLDIPSVYYPEEEESENLDETGNSEESQQDITEELEN